ncbi:efflux RND transporter permease subunit [Pontiellaceae bacterium B12227]|nr:efflux RND transporter permease subunit [Pontiellaceae bacterium B12227]
MRRLMSWFSLHPVFTLIVIGLISAVATIPASRVRIEASIDSLMMENDPDKAYYLETRELFGSEATALVYSEDPDLFAPAKLEALQNLVYELENIEGVISAESLFSVTEITNTDGLLDIHPLISWIPETETESSNLRKSAGRHPVIKGLLLSPTSDATIIQLRYETDKQQKDALRTLSEAIEQTIAPYTPLFQRLEQMGRPYIVERQTAYILRDQRVVLPLAVCVLVIMLVLILNSFKGAVLPLLTSGVSILWTLAFMGILDLPITALSFMVPSLIIVIGSTEDIHLLAEYRSGRMEGLRRNEAVKRMVSRLAIAVVFTAATTFSGFATIIATPIPVLREFGLVASFGLLVNPIVTISLIPACLALLPDRSAHLRPLRFFAVLEARTLNLLSATRRHPGITLTTFFIVCLSAGIYGIIHVEADNNLISFFRPESPVVERVDRLQKAFSGSENFCIRLDAQVQGAFKDPEVLQYAIQLQSHLQQQYWLGRSISVTDYLSYIHQAFIDDGSVLPDSRQAIAEYLLLLHHTEIEPYVTPDFQSLNIMVRHNVRSSKELMPLIEQLREYIRSTRPDNVEIGITGETLLVNKAVSAIVRGQLRGVLVIALIAAISMSLLFRSFRIGFIGLIPNLLPIGIQFGIMALVGIPLNTATSMAAAISIGLAVDDTIHLLMRFYGQSSELPPAEAVDRSLNHLLRPVVATTISLILGFYIMRFSHFTPISDFAFLAAVVLTSALLADLIITPTLLSLPIMHPGKRTAIKPHKGIAEL